MNKPTKILIVVLVGITLLVVYTKLISPILSENAAKQTKEQLTASLTEITAKLSPKPDLSSWNYACFQGQHNYKVQQNFNEQCVARVTYYYAVSSDIPTEISRLNFGGVEFESSSLIADKVSKMHQQLTAEGLSVTYDDPRVKYAADQDNGTTHLSYAMVNRIDTDDVSRFQNARGLSTIKTVSGGDAVSMAEIIALATTEKPYILIVSRQQAYSLR